MPKQNRIKSEYPGVFYIEGHEAGSGRPERIFYITYRKDGKLIEEKAGRQFRNRMTAAKANIMRGERLAGKQLSNEEKRQEQKAREEAEKGKATITNLWNQYKEEVMLKGLFADESRFEKHLKPVFGDRVPSELNEDEVKEFKTELSKKLKPQSVKNTLALLRRIVNWGAKERKCAKLPFKIVMPKVDNLVTEQLDGEQLKNLLKAIKEDQHEQAGAMLKVAVLTGLRRSEIFRLKWEDLDFQSEQIRLTNTKSGKTKYIPMNDLSKPLLQSLPKNSELVFTGRSGKWTDIRKAVNRIKERAGLPASFRSFHGLRHSFASILALKGVDLLTISKLLGHSDISVTQRYAHLTDRAKQQASNLAAEAIKQALPK